MTRQRPRQLLAESGMEGQEVKILATAGAAEQQMALLLQAQWQAIGLKPKIVNVDTGAWWDATGKGDYDAAATWWFNETLRPGPCRALGGVRRLRLQLLQHLLQQPEGGQAGRSRGRRKPTRPSGRHL